MRWLFRDAWDEWLRRREVARVVVADGLVAGAMCTGGVLWVAFAGVVGGGTTALGVVAGTATDSLALLGAFTIASNDGLSSRLFSDAPSFACCFLFANAFGGVPVAEVFVPAVAEGALATEDASDAEEARSASSSSGDNAFEEATDASVSAWRRASLARAKLGRRCNRRRRCRRGCRRESRVDESEFEDTAVEAVERERRAFCLAVRARLVRGAAPVLRTRFVFFVFGACFGGVTLRGGGVTSASSELSESESELFGPFFADSDMDDASSEALGSDTTDDRLIECPKACWYTRKVS